MGGDGERRADKHLPEIAAMIDPRQFELITRPSSGLVVIQGGAGSGKTTIGLHRLAYLAYQEPKRFRKDAHAGRGLQQGAGSLHLAACCRRSASRACRS